MVGRLVETVPGLIGVFPMVKVAIASGPPILPGLLRIAVDPREFLVPAPIGPVVLGRQGT